MPLHVLTHEEEGYLTLIEQLETWLAEVTGYDSVSLQPNAGSQGELAGLLAALSRTNFPTLAKVAALSAQHRQHNWWVVMSAGLIAVTNQIAASFYTDPVVLMGMIFILVGIAFKLAAFPFHFWCPDVFEGAAAEVAAFLSVASKGAALALLDAGTDAGTVVPALVAGLQDQIGRAHV